MDRREALKKLAAGGAIAATGSVVLSSRDVAYAASGPGTSLTEIPGPSEPLPITVQTNISNNGKTGTVTVGDNTSPTCGSGTMMRSYSWRINSYNISGGNSWKLQIKDSNDSQVIADFISTNFSQPNSNHGIVLLRKANNGGAAKPLDRDDDYSVDMFVTWQCSGAGAYVEAIYRFSATFPDPPTVSVQYYEVL